MAREKNEIAGCGFSEMLLSDSLSPGRPVSTVLAHNAFSGHHCLIGGAECRVWRRAGVKRRIPVCGHIRGYSQRR